MKLFMKLASQRLDELYRQWQDGELKSHPYSIAREKLTRTALIAYFKSQGKVAEYQVYAWHDRLAVKGGYGQEVSDLINEHLTWRAGNQYNDFKTCQSYSAYGYMPWYSSVKLVHLLGGNPNGHVG